LESLKKYEEELKNELNTVGQRVKELESTKKQAKTFGQLIKLLLNCLNKKEVIKMAEKKNNCGCGCISLKQTSEKAGKGKKKAKKSK